MHPLPCKNFAGSGALRTFAVWPTYFISMYVQSYCWLWKLTDIILYSHISLLHYLENLVSVWESSQRPPDHLPRGEEVAAPSQEPHSGSRPSVLPQWKVLGTPCNSRCAVAARSSATRFRLWQKRWTASNTWAVSSLYIGQQCPDLCHGHGLCVTGQCRLVVFTRLKLLLHRLQSTQRESK